MQYGKSVKFGVGWLKQTRDGGEYISAIPGGPSKDERLKLIVEDGKGNQIEVENFAVFFNQDKKSAKAPDVSFVFTPKE